MRIKSNLSEEVHWTIDKAHSEIGFRVKHLMIAYVKGNFRHFNAEITTRGTDFTWAKINLEIQADSITTGDQERDEHLMGADFLDVLNHEQIVFSSHMIGKSMPDRMHKVYGDLTIAGKTKPIHLLVKFGGILVDPWGNEKAGFQVSGKINRHDWGLNWNTPLKAGGFLIGDMINIASDIELINATQRARVRDAEYLVRQI